MAPGRGISLYAEVTAPRRLLLLPALLAAAAQALSADVATWRRNAADRGGGYAFRGSQAERFLRSATAAAMRRGRAEEARGQQHAAQTPGKGDDAGMTVLSVQSGGQGSCITNQRRLLGPPVLKMKACEFRRDQRFYFHQKMLKSAFNHQCLTIEGNSGLKLTDCTSHPDQLWKFEAGRIESASPAASEMCLRIKGKKPSESKILVTKCDELPEQQFRLQVQMPKAGLLMENSICEQGMEFLGVVDTVQKCMKRNEEKESWYFNYGKAGMDAGKCYKVAKMLSFDPTCSPMFSNANYDFWQLQPGAEAELIQFDTSCMSPESYMGEFGTLQYCAEAVRNQGGRFFVYGKDMDAKRCYMKITKTRKCEEGLMLNVTFDFFEITTLEHIIGLEAELVKHDMRCHSGEQEFGTMTTALDCMQALVRDSPTVQAKGTAFFAYGKGKKDEECVEEYTSTKDCTEGWQSTPDYDFFRVAFSEAELIATNVYCRSKKEALGLTETAEECLAKGKEKFARFIAFGKASKAGQCYKDYTDSPYCPEGFESNLFDLYRVVSTEAQCKMPSGVNFAATYTCMEGLLIQHQEQCTPSCLEGYAPNYDKLDCFDGVFKPSTFVCIDTHAQKAAALNEEEAEEAAEELEKKQLNSESSGGKTDVAKTSSLQETKKSGDDDDDDDDDNSASLQQTANASKQITLEKYSPETGMDVVTLSGENVDAVETATLQQKQLADAKAPAPDNGDEATGNTEAEQEPANSGGAPDSTEKKKPKAPLENRLMQGLSAPQVAGAIVSSETDTGEAQPDFTEPTVPEEPDTDPTEAPFAIRQGNFNEAEEKLNKTEDEDLLTSDEANDWKDEDLLEIGQKDASPAHDRGAAAKGLLRAEAGDGRPHRHQRAARQQQHHHSRAGAGRHRSGTKSQRHGGHGHGAGDDGSGGESSRGDDDGAGAAEAAESSDTAEPLAVPR